MPSDASESDCPPLGYESVDWSPTVPVDLLTGAYRERYRGPHSSADVPAIAECPLRFPTMSPHWSLRPNCPLPDSTPSSDMTSDRFVPFCCVRSRRRRPG